MDLAPVIIQTKKTLDKISNEGKSFASPIAKALKKGIETRFQVICEFRSAERNRAVFAAMSFPYFKTRWIPGDKTEQLKSEFISHAKTLGQAVNRYGTFQSPAEPSKDDKFFDFQDNETVLSQQAFSDQIELECLKYFQDASKDLSSLSCYPTISEMFLKYNTSIASSAPVERVFSYSGIILSPKRSRLSDEMLEQLLFLKTKGYSVN